jgi:hypothetical protein
MCGRLFVRRILIGIRLGLYDCEEAMELVVSEVISLLSVISVFIAKCSLEGAS